MKKTLIMASVITAGLAMNSCGLGTTAPVAQTTTPAQGGAAAVGAGLGNILAGANGGTQGMLGNLLSGLLSSATTVTAQSIVGTWQYDSPECRFESENFLTQAGGTMIASKVESRLADIFGKVGVRQGACSFTFAQGNQAALNIGGRAINGTYTVDPATRHLTFVSSTGLVKLNATVYQTGNTLTLLFDAQKLLTVVQGLGGALGSGGNTVGTLTSLLNQYKGMQLGMNLTR